MDVARAPGPRWLRIALAGCALVYYFLLLRHPSQRLEPLTFFTECTCLFPDADRYAIEFRLEGWSCGDAQWEPMDPRPYFPLEADDKESRFQRLGYFYNRSRTAMRALTSYILARHDGARDDVPGAIGGIRLSRLQRELPPPGASVDRYIYRPTAPPLADDNLEHLYWTPESERRQTCGGAR